VKVRNGNEIKRIEQRGRGLSMTNTTPLNKKELSKIKNREFIPGLFHNMPLRATTRSNGNTSKTMKKKRQNA
jgi:hypothetical protein